VHSLCFCLVFINWFTSLTSFAPTCLIQTRLHFLTGSARTISCLYPLSQLHAYQHAAYRYDRFHPPPSNFRLSFAFCDFNYVGLLAFGTQLSNRTSRNAVQPNVKKPEVKNPTWRSVTERGCGIRHILDVVHDSIEIQKAISIFSRSNFPMVL